MAHSASRLARALLAVEVVRSALRDSHGSTIVPGRIGPDTSAGAARRAFTFSVAYGNEVAQQTAGLVDTVRRGSRVETYPRSKWKQCLCCSRHGDNTPGGSTPQPCL